MTTEKALNGKPYAGNPHVRFDEGEVASCTAEASLRRRPCRRQPEGCASRCAATPRRGSLLYIGKLSAIIAAAAVNAAAAGENVAQNSIAADVRRPVPVVDAKVGGFWHDEYRLLVTKWLPHCIKEMEAGGRGEELLNLVATGEVLAGKKPCVKFKGHPWSDAYPYNTLEAICLALEIDPGDDVGFAKAQEFLRAKMEEWIPIILAAQEPSGYIHSYHDLRREPHFSNAAKHEFYVMGYFIEMGIAHYRATKGRDRRLYDAAIRCADHLDSVFGPPPKRTWLTPQARDTRSAVWPIPSTPPRARGRERSMRVSRGTSSATSTGPRATTGSGGRTTIRLICPHGR